MGYAFISYSSKNKDKADAMREVLKKNNIDTWMAPYDIPVGSQYGAVLADAVHGCACLVLILSEDSKSSQWVDKEVNLAVSYKKPIVPVQIGDCSLYGSAMELYLSNCQIVTMDVIDDISILTDGVLDMVSYYTKVLQENEQIFEAEKVVPQRSDFSEPEIDLPVDNKDKDESGRSAPDTNRGSGSETAGYFFAILSALFIIMTFIVDDPVYMSICMVVSVIFALVWPRFNTTGGVFISMASLIVSFVRIGIFGWNLGGVFGLICAILLDVVLAVVYLSGYDKK